MPRILSMSHLVPLETHSPILTHLPKMGCISIGSRAHHSPQLDRRSLCTWREEWLNLRDGHGGSERKGPLDELPVRL